MNKKTLFSILLGVLISPTIALAEVVCEEGVISIPCMINTAVDLTLYIASGVVVIIWVIAGILLMSASGDPAKLTSGRKALVAAVAGTVLIIVAASALYLVGSAFGLGSLVNNASY